MSDIQATVREALMKKLAEKGIETESSQEEVKKVEPSSFFLMDEPEAQANQKEYAEIIGEAHPSGQKYYFTVYTDTDWDEDVRDLIPEVDTGHQFDHDYALAILMGIEYDKGVFAYGPPGSGKSVTPEQICARIRYPFKFISGMGGTEPSDYVGSPWVEEGSMSWKDAEASMCVRKGVFMLYDEPFKSSAQTNMCFQSLLDSRRTLKLYGHPDPVHGSLKAHPKFRMALADNVRGVGDGMGDYAAEIQDKSFLNRCAYKVHVGYVDPKTEKALLKSRFGHLVADTLIDRVVSMAGLLRNAWNKGDLSLPYSLRDTQECVEAAALHRDPARAFAQTYYDYVPDEERAAVRDLWNTTVFPEAQYKLNK